ncbi:testis-expressed protein 264 [Anarrhichthys ocellatus]|uniref:testis-expressed protein 264 n=1 Tax=Anarrhichthys ocellatus TaxID=433405 RepID=UPI0012ECF9A6|nr:testis-expressed protein 264-like [Anarrhichthys ocellatus]
MSDIILVLLLLVLLVCLIVTVGGLLIYSGLLSDVIIKTGPPPVRNVTIAYKFREGSYKDCGAAYTESCSIGPKLNTVGVFYDDPKQRPAEKCRYVVGSVLCEGEEKPDEELQKMYEKFGFKVFSLPEVSHAVTTSFDCTTPLSHVVGPYRVYPRLASYIEERKLCAFPTIEICSQDVIKYMVPLSRQTDFFVPEMKEEVKTDVKEEDSDEDRGTDITGNVYFVHTTQTYLHSAVFSAKERSGSTHYLSGIRGYNMACLYFFNPITFVLAALNTGFSGGALAK